MEAELQEIVETVSPVLPAYTAACRLKGELLWLGRVVDGDTTYGPLPKHHGLCVGAISVCTQWLRAESFSDQCEQMKAIFQKYYPTTLLPR